MIRRSLLRTLGRTLRPGVWKQAEEMVLVDFSREADRAALSDAKQWACWSDGVDMGGGSACTLEASEEDGGKAVFSGHISQTVTPGGMRDDVVASGFAAVRYKLPVALTDVSEFDSFVLDVRAKGRSFAFNIKPESFIPDDMYQGYLQFGEQRSKWAKATLPFSDLILIGRGRLKETQRTFDYPVIDSIGFATYGFDGPFSLEVKSIKVIVANADDEKRGRLNSLRFG